MRTAAILMVACAGAALADGGNGGYYTDYNQGAIDPAQGIADNGLVPVQITSLTGYPFETLDVLVLNESCNCFPDFDVTNALPDIQAWVEGGGKLIVHDRYVSSGALENSPFFIGAPGMQALRDFANDDNIDILNDTTTVTDGPFGVLDDTSLDQGTSSSHGYVDADTLPTQQSVAILNRGGAIDEIVSLSYTLGDGAVFYSTIPLDYYLAGFGGDPPTTAMNTIYYPNVIDYMLNLSAGCAADCNGDGNLDILDFVCFQTEWTAQTEAGDCDGNGLYNILDFVCFQGLFQDGCD